MKSVNNEDDNIYRANIDIGMIHSIEKYNEVLQRKKLSSFFPKKILRITFIASSVYFDF